MIARHLLSQLNTHLEQFPAVALLGPRQVGKTTLALALAEQIKAHAGNESLYLDLELPSDRAKLAEPELYLAGHTNKLVIIDEVQREPGLFQVLRGLIDQGRHQGLKTGRFLLLGSASIELIHQTSESLAGRIAYLELTPFGVNEIEPTEQQKLWVRGGFPESFLANNDRDSLVWRENFIRTYLERDIPNLGPRVPAETLRRFWTMLAHVQGGLLNASQLARGLAVDGKTIARYLDLLVDLLLVRRLLPWHGNVGKRLVKSPRIYIRDSGLTHALLGIDDIDSLLAHPVAGMSWEGFVIENLISASPQMTQTSFYRTATGAEIDLLLELPNAEKWAIEIKRGLSPKLTKGTHLARMDVKADKTFVVYSGNERYAIADGIDVIGLAQLIEILNATKK